MEFYCQLNHQFLLLFFEAVFIASVVDFVAYLEVFNHSLLFMFFAKDKNLYPSTILISKPYFNSLKFWIKCFEKDMTYGEISNKLPNDLFGTNLYKTLESFDNHYWKYYNELILLLQFQIDAHFQHFCF